jgi:hypothetical protein
MVCSTAYDRPDDAAACRASSCAVEKAPSATKNWGQVVGGWRVGEWEKELWLCPKLKLTDGSWCWGGVWESEGAGQEAEDGSWERELHGGFVMGWFFGGLES